MAAYYNEHDPFAAQWLRNLIAAGHIAPGTVDERSIEDVHPTDLVGYTQCHFFAGIGVWSYALRKAGWPDDRPIWTGSCPCQPFSSAGKGLGVADERHLWPAWFHLIERARAKGIPVLGEQVANGDGLTWLDLVQTDLEGAGFAFGAYDLCAAGFGAPHIRQRLFFYASEGLDQVDAFGEGLEGQPRSEHNGNEPGRLGADPVGSVAQASGAHRMADPGHSEHQRRDGLRDTDGGDDAPQGTDQGSGEGGNVQAGQRSGDDLAIRGTGSGLADAERIGVRGEGSGSDGTTAIRMQGEDGQRERVRLDPGSSRSALDAQGGPGPINGRWRAADWLFCKDGKWRAVEPGTFPLADGATSRVGRLRAYGNAINAEVAAEFIKAVMPQLKRAA